MRDIIRSRGSSSKRPFFFFCSRYLSDMIIRCNELTSTQLSCTFQTVKLCEATTMIGKVCMVILHGSGSCGQDIAGYLDSVPIPEYRFETFRDAASALSMDIITPSAASRRYTPFGGERCNVWYDRSADFMRKGLSDIEDFDGTEQSLEKVLLKIEQIESKYDHIFIGGFSMGGGLALHTLRKHYPEKLRGIFTMGSFLVQESAVVTGPLGRSAQVPILMMHGESDSMIRCEWGRQTASNLLLRDLNVQFRTYKNVDHEMDTSELADLLDWVKDTLLLHLEEAASASASIHKSDAKKSNSSNSSTKDVEAGSKDQVGHDRRNTSAGEMTSMAPSKEDDVHTLLAPSSAAQSKGGDDYHDTSSKHSCYLGVRDAGATEMEMEMEVGLDVGATAEVTQSAAQLQQDQRDRHLQQRQTRTALSAPAPSGSAQKSKGEEEKDEGEESDDRSLAVKAGMYIPYTVEYIHATGPSRSTTASSSTATATAAIGTTSIPSVRLRYAVPQDLIGVLSARPVLACGSMFEILPDSPNGVSVLLQSSDPHSTAVQIGLRLQNRISGGSASLNPCPVS